jgi:hypothetical protein
VRITYLPELGLVSFGVTVKKNLKFVTDNVPAITCFMFAGSMRQHTQSKTKIQDSAWLRRNKKRKKGKNYWRENEEQKSKGQE